MLIISMCLSRFVQLFGCHGMTLSTQEVDCGICPCSLAKNEEYIWLGLIKYKENYCKGNLLFTLTFWCSTEQSDHDTRTEAAIHAMKAIFASENTDAVL